MIIDEIKKTKTFKSLELLQKKVIIEKFNRDLIEHGAIVAKNIGYENWEKQCGYNGIKKKIVKEIIGLK